METLRRGAPLQAAGELRAFARRLRRRRFELVLDFHSLLRSALLARLSAAPLRLGYARPFGRELSYWLATHRAVISPRRMSRFERNAALVRTLGIEAPPAESPLWVDPVASARVRARLGPHARPVALHPGSSNVTAHKRWSPEAYGRLARALADAEGVASVVTWGPARDDRHAAEAVVAASQGGCAPGTGHTRLRRPGGPARGLSALRRRRHRPAARGLAGGHPRGAAARSYPPDRERPLAPYPGAHGAPGRHADRGGRRRGHGHSRRGRARGGSGAAAGVAARAGPGRGVKGVGFDAGRLEELLDAFGRVRLVVLGDLVLDEYVWGDVGRISPEAPVPVVDVSDETVVLGGAGNVVRNVVALGGRAAFCSVVGDDAAGRLAADLLKNLGVDTEGLVVVEGRPTTRKTRVVARSQSGGPLLPAGERASIARPPTRYLSPPLVA